MLDFIQNYIITALYKCLAKAYSRNAKYSVLFRARTSSTHFVI